MIRRVIAGVLCLLIPELALADLSNTARVGYVDSSGNPRVVLSNTVTVVVTAGALPAPTLNLPSVLPVNAQINASEPPGYVVTAYNWSVIPQTTSSGSVASSAGVLARAASASFSTASGVANLTPHNLDPGNYLITVTATDSNNNISPQAQAIVTLVPVDFSDVRVFPNPWRADKHTGHPITFDHLTAGSTVKIFTVSGHEVKSLVPSVDTVTWDLTTDSGDRAASGLYLYLITNDQGQKVRGQLAIIR